MYDTETDELVSRNIISQQHQDSVLWLNGHSGEISRQHYLRKKQVNAVNDGRYVMDLILNGAVDDASRSALDLDVKQHSEVGEYRENDIAVDEDGGFDYNDSDRNQSFEVAQDAKWSVSSVGSVTSRFKEQSFARDDCGIDDVGDLYGEPKRTNSTGKYSPMGSIDPAINYDFERRNNSSKSLYDHKIGNEFNRRANYTSERCALGDYDMESRTTKRMRSSYDNVGENYDNRPLNSFSHEKEKERFDPAINYGLERRSSSAKSFSDHNISILNPENKFYRRALVSERFSDYDMEPTTTNLMRSSYDDVNESYDNNRPLSSFSHKKERSYFSQDVSSKAATTIRHSMGDRYFNTNEKNNALEAEEIEVLRPLPLRFYSPRRLEAQAYVRWTAEEVEYTKKAYDVIYKQLLPEQKRFISSELLKFIRNDPDARNIFHPSHLTCSTKFRHVIREYIQKDKVVDSNKDEEDI